MFNKKLKQQIEELKKLKFSQDTEILKLTNLVKEKEAEVKRLQVFDKVIDEKLKTLLTEKVDNFLLNSVATGLCVSGATFTSTLSVLNKNYSSLETLLTEQAKEIQALKERDEENKKLLFLAGKVEQLLNKLNKK